MTPTKNMQSIIDDGEEEDFTRKRQYSFMGNHLSSYKLGSEMEF